MLTLLLSLASLVVADSTAPTFRASAVYVTGDTVWFQEDVRPGTVTPVAVVGYVRSTGRWFLARRSWRQIVPRHVAERRSGVLSDYVEPDASGERKQPLAYGFSIIDTTAQLDPRFVGQDDAVFHSTPRSALVAPWGAREELRVRITGAERRRLYLASGWTLEPRQVPPPFTTYLERWASGEGVLAFAFPAPEPPEVPRFPTEEELNRPPEYLGGFAVFDMRQRRLRPALHPQLLERRYTGLEVAGGALWVALRDDIEGGGVDDPRLARYDLATGRWTFLGSGHVPLAGEFRDMAGDGTRLFVVGADGVGVLDTRTSRWDVRYYADSSYQLPDGADTTITLLTARRRMSDRPSAGDGPDTNEVLRSIAAELAPRHRTAFIEVLRDRVPLDSLAELVIEMGLGPSYVCDDPCPFRNVWERAGDMLRRPEFVPFLREAMWRPATQGFAASVLGGLGDSVYASALRATLDSGTLVAAVAAADTLVGRGDPAGLRWLRSRLYDPAVVSQLDPVPGSSDRPMELVARTLVRHRDTASVPRLLELLWPPGVREVPAYPAWGPRWYVPRILIQLPDSGSRRRLALGMAERPVLWPLLLHWVAADSVPTDDPGVRAAASRAAVAAVSLSDSAWDALDGGILKLNREPRERALRSVLARPAKYEPRTLIPALVASLGRDTTYAYWKIQALVQVTANDAAPREPLGAADVRRSYDYWSAWWARHVASFTPVSEEAGKAAFKRWAERR